MRQFPRHFLRVVLVGLGVLGTVTPAHAAGDPITQAVEAIVGVDALTIAANDAVIEISCRMRGIDVATGEWQEIVSGTFRVRRSEIPAQPAFHYPEGCTPRGVNSPLWGQEGGTRIMLSASMCNEQGPYYYAKIFMNGLPIVGWLDEKLRLSLGFNEDPTSFVPGNYVNQDERPIVVDPPLTLPEGTFREVHLGCFRGPLRPLPE